MKADSLQMVKVFSQWGGVRKKQNGRLLDGRTWDEMPALAFTA